MTFYAVALDLSYESTACLHESNGLHHARDHYTGQDKEYSLLGRKGRGEHLDQRESGLKAVKAIWLDGPRRPAFE